MLLGLEWYMKDGRRVLFAVTVFLSALSNYYFFIGQVFFPPHLLVRAHAVRRLGVHAAQIPLAVFRGHRGTAGAAVLLLLLSRGDTESPDGQHAGRLGFPHLQQTPAPVRHPPLLFLPAGYPREGEFLPDSDNKWASMSAWLPVFGCTGAIACFQSANIRIGCGAC